MPLVGVIDPSHSASRKRTPGVLPPWVTTEQALDRALTNPKWAPWSFELLNSIFGEHQERGARITASALVTHCPRALVLERCEDYVSDLKDLYMPWKGTMVHRTLELYAHEQALAEYRFYSTLTGVEVSCSPDLLTKTTLYDYKYTENPPMYSYPWSNHTEQVMLNAYICRNATAVQRPGAGATQSFDDLPFDPREHPATSVALMYLGPKWPKLLVVEGRAEEVYNASTGKFKKQKSPVVWGDEYVESLFGPRALMLERALESYPTFPAGAEKLWGGDATWECPGDPLCGLANCLAKRKTLKW
jgi:hypothetical protein